MMKVTRRFSKRVRNVWIPARFGASVVIFIYFLLSGSNLKSTLLIGFWSINSINRERFWTFRSNLNIMLEDFLFELINDWLDQIHSNFMSSRELWVRESLSFDDCLLLLL